MRHFLPLIKRQLDRFSAFSEMEITIPETVFSKKTGKIVFFIQEIENTALLLSQQQSEEYADVYAQRLFRQFEALNKAMMFLKRKKTEPKERFHSPFRFPKNIHALSPHKRLLEYRKALRALNEKISWLVEKSYQADEYEKNALQIQIEETEYRKRKCLKAIEDLEEQLQFK